MQSWQRIIFAFILVIAVFLAIFSMRRLSLTFDETAHIPAGYVYWKTGDFRLNPQHPTFVKLIAAVPLILDSKITANLSDESLTFLSPNQWKFGDSFFTVNRSNTDRLLFEARLMIVGLFVLLLVFVFRFGRELYDVNAGLIAMGLVAFSPTALAHARVVTTDIAVTAFVTVASFYLYVLLKPFFAIRSKREAPPHVRWRPLIFLSLATGLACISKYSGILLFPVIAFVLLFALIRGHVRFKQAVLVSLVVTVVTVLCIWASYFFSKSPILYFYGMQTINQDRPAGYYAFLLGQAKQGTWWYYFAVAGFLKTPVAYLLALAGALYLFIKKRTEKRTELLFLFVPAAIFFIAVSLKAAPIGARYILPTLPFLSLFIAGFYKDFLSGRFSAILGGIAIAWYVSQPIISYPNYFAYGNELISGSSNTYKYLDDSNVDWGGGLKDLKSYMDTHGIEAINFVYEAHGQPEAYDIKVLKKFDLRDWLSAPIQKGTVYAVSTNAYIRGYMSNQINNLNSPWFTKYKPIDRVSNSFFIYQF